MSISETNHIAHTARCKLQLAADRPDRNLRFILGHTFTLDNLLVQIAQIEDIQIAQIEEVTKLNFESDAIGVDTASAPSPDAVEFLKSTNKPLPSSCRGRSPPPDKADTHSSRFLADDENEDGEDPVSEKFASAALSPPRMIADNGSDNEDELISPPGSLSKDELRRLT
jgi:hypothetical protein